MTTISAWLAEHRLGKHIALFAEHDIDLDVLADLTDSDLEKLGVSLGDRRRFLQAVEVFVAAEAPTEAALSETRDAERRQLTVMFADLVGSTNLAARLDPEEMNEIIAGYQKAVGDEISRFGGYVAKSLGDGLLIYFGWPQAHEDDAERALRAAIDSVTAVGKLRTPEGEKLGARIGIATGEVMVGDFSGEGFAEAGAVVGETPNLAARLQALAGENAIVVSDKTRKLVGRQFGFSDLGDQNLKGFDVPVRAWRLDGELSSESRFDALHGVRLGALIGREHELGFLLDRWQQASEGECQLVLISGEAGIGKSRLVSEVVQQLALDRRISYQASPLHTNTGLYPVIRHLELKAGFSADDALTEKFRKLAAIMPNQTAGDRVALAYLADLMSLPTPTGDGFQAAKPAVDVQRDSALEALVDAVETSAALGPLLIVVEDAQWLDATTQEFIERILARMRSRQVMLVITFRPEFVPPWAQHGNVGLLTLSRVGRRHALAIVHSLISDGQGLSPKVAEAIVAKSDGVPLFVEELTGSMLNAARSGEGQSSQIPSTLRDTLSERLDKLGSAKEVAQVAATIGREFSLDLTAATLGRQPADLNDDLNRLMDIGVVFRSSRSDGRFVFKHALLQDAAYDCMLKSRRREVHARIAQVLTKLRPNVSETEPEVLAKHFEQAGNKAEAAASWRKAGQVALQSSAYREAINAFTKSLELEPEVASAAQQRVDTNRMIATAYFATADIMSMRRHLDAAASEADATEDRVLVAEIAIQRCHVLNIFGGRISDAREVGQQALQIALERDDEQLAYGARFALGQSYWAAGECSRGIELLAANLPENLDDPDLVRDFGTAGSLMIDSVATLGACYGHRGEFDRAVELFEQARALSGRIPSTAFDQMVVDSHPARAFLQRGDWAAAVPLLESNRDLCREAGLRMSMPWQTGFLGYARVLAGDTEEGIALLEEAVNDCPAVCFEVMLTVHLAESLLSSQPAAALQTAHRALSLSQDLGYRAQEAASLRLVGAALAASEPGTAEMHATQALALTRTLGLRPEEAHALRALGDIQVIQHRAEEADENFGRARTIYGELKMDRWLELSE